MLSPGRLLSSSFSRAWNRGLHFLKNKIPEERGGSRRSHSDASEPFLAHQLCPQSQKAWPWITPLEPNSPSIAKKANPLMSWSWMLCCFYPKDQTIVAKKSLCISYESQVKKVLTEPGSWEIKIKHAYKVPKQLSNGFNEPQMVLLKTNNCFLFYHANMDMTLINQLVNYICTLQQLSTCDTRSVAPVLPGHGCTKMMDGATVSCHGVN